MVNIILYIMCIYIYVCVCVGRDHRWNPADFSRMEAVGVEPEGWGGSQFDMINHAEGGPNTSSTWQIMAGASSLPPNSLLKQIQLQLAS